MQAWGYKWKFSSKPCNILSYSVLSFSKEYVQGHRGGSLGAGMEKCAHSTALLMRWYYKRDEEMKFMLTAPKGWSFYSRVALMIIYK